jgi:hypothetical protein
MKPSLRCSACSIRNDGEPAAPPLLGRSTRYFPPVDLTVDTFQPELDVALRSYDRHVVCMEKVTEDCEKSLRSLMQKAINAYVNRGVEMRHGIALDRHVTIILSQTDGEKPLCGIYFNLHSPYAKKSAPAAENAPASKSAGTA